jgi:hypothetical protein
MLDAMTSHDIALLEEVTSEHLLDTMRRVTDSLASLPHVTHRPD